jgi:hypothetical protein
VVLAFHMLSKNKSTLVHHNLLTKAKKPGHFWKIKKKPGQNSEVQENPDIW